MDRLSGDFLGAPAQDVSIRELVGVVPDLARMLRAIVPRSGVADRRAARASRPPRWDHLANRPDPQLAVDGGVIEAALSAMLRELDVALEVECHPQAALTWSCAQAYRAS